MESEQKKRMRESFLHLADESGEQLNASWNLCNGFFLRPTFYN